MKATVSWDKDMTFTGQTDTGHSLTLDGNGNTTSPMEAVLLSVGACSSIDVVEIMKKSRQDISDCVCQLDATRNEEPPRYFTKIHVHYQVSGQNISEKHLNRAVQLSAEKYCSVMLMLNKSVEITTSFEIV